MNAINAFLTAMTELLFRPIVGLPPLIPLLVISVVMGVLMAWIFRMTSNQKAIKAAADTVRAQLLAMKLFKDDLRVTLSCQVYLFKAVGVRLMYSLPPMVAMCVPVVLLLTQLAMRYEFRPLQIGEKAVVQLELSEAGWQERENIRFKPPPGIEVQTPALHDESEYSVYWRIHADSASTEPLRWNFGDQVIEKKLLIDQDEGKLSALSPRRPGSGWMDRLLYPDESGFVGSGLVAAVEVGLPTRSTPIFGVDVPWWLTFFIVAMLAALAAKPWLKVQF